jgi:hypothetical protein
MIIAYRIKPGVHPEYFTRWQEGWGVGGTDPGATYNLYLILKTAL